MVDSQMHVPLSYQRVQYICSGMPCLAFPLHWTGKEGVIRPWMTNVALGQRLLLNAFSMPLLDKLSDGWLASGRLPDVTSNEGKMALLWGRDPAVHSPHIPNPQSPHPQVKNRGLKCPGCPSSLSSNIFISAAFSHPSASSFWHRFTAVQFMSCVKNKPPGCETLYTMYEIMLWGSTTIFRLTKFYVRDLISTFPMSELKSM